MLILTWLWHQPNGRAKFTADHVNIWAAMIRRNCTLDFELAVATDMPEGIDPSIRIIDPPDFHAGLEVSRWRSHRPSCFRRLSIYAPNAAEIFGAERICQMDLDLVITGSIDSILDRPEDLVLCAPTSPGNPRFRYNGSMQMLTAGARPHVYEDFSPEAAEAASRQFVGSDQAWLAQTLGTGEALFTEADGVTRWGQSLEGRMIFFPGTVKPWNAIEHPLVGEHYRIDHGKRGLILGERETLWDDVSEAIGFGPFEVVIALPRAARAYKGQITAIAEDRRHAELLAQMHGCPDPIACGF